MSAKQLVWIFFGFSGRISRAVYVLTALLTMVALMFLLYRVMIGQEADSSATQGWDAAFSIAALVSLWTQAALSAKRIQDFGRSGFFAVLLFLPVVNVIGFFVLCLYPGDSGPNQYGKRTDSPR